MRLLTLLLALLLAAQTTVVGPVKIVGPKTVSMASGGGGIALGAVGPGSTAGATSVSATINTQASGSCFRITAGTTGTAAATPVTDSKGLTWTQRQHDSGGAGVTNSYSFTACGAGQASDVFTFHTTGSAPSSIWVQEIKNATGLDQTGAPNTTTVAPFISTAITTTFANEVILSSTMDNSSGAGDTFTCLNSFTCDADAVTDGSQFVTGVSSSQTVSSTGTYHSQYTSAQGSQFVTYIESFH